MKSTIRSSLAHAIAHELESAETLLWQAQPSRTRELMRKGWKSIIGLAVTAFATVWTISLGGGLDDPNKSDVGLLVIAVLFLCVGVGHLLSPLWAWWLASRTAYAVTNKRALIVTRGWRKTVRGYARSSLGHFVRTERRNGSGDLVFERLAVKDGRNVVTRDIGFFGVANVRDVQRMLQEPAA